MTKEIRALINRVNAQKSTGPRTSAGRQRSSMNAVKHNLTGSRLILQPDEMEAYNCLSHALISELKPMTELERQTAQKIVDSHFRLNRLAGVENNVFNFGLIDNTMETPHDDRIEVMIAQTRSWIERCGVFDLLGRYEARLARQALQYTLEFERLQKDRSLKPEDIKPDTFELASFSRKAPQFVMQVLTNLPPHKPRSLPTLPPAEGHAATAASVLVSESPQAEASSPGLPSHHSGG